jgi:hypothetical protein
MSRGAGYGRFPALRRAYIGSKDLLMPEKTHSCPCRNCALVKGCFELLRWPVAQRGMYAVSSDGMKLFGVMDLETTGDGYRFSLGLRNANDKSMRLGLVVGLRVRRPSRP